MQSFGLHRCFYQAAQINGKLLSKEALIRLDRVRIFITLTQKGMRSIEASHQLGIPKSTLNRWVKAYREQGPRGLEPRSRRPNKVRRSKWTQELVKRILSLRRTFPLWGKFKLTILLKKEGFTASESTVGRIIKRLCKQGKIHLGTVFRKKFGYKKRKIMRPYAERLPKEMKANKIGELIQIDHMTPDGLPGFGCKQFAAICPVSRYAIVELYPRATSRTARDFLRKVLREMPFTIKGIQVDGGSEFMSVFEEECRILGLKLYVLPPRTPELNGSVERSNATWRYEFYWSYSGYLQLNLNAMRKSLAAFQKIYNEYRPHQSLNGKTPSEYLNLNTTPMNPLGSYVIN